MTIMRPAIDEDPILVLRLILGYRQQTREMIDPASANRADYRRKLSSDQTGRWCRELLYTAQLATRPLKRGVAKVEVMYCELLMEAASGVRKFRKDPEYDFVVVPHQISTHYVPAWIETRKS